MMRITLKVKTFVQIIVVLLLAVVFLYVLLPQFKNVDGATISIPWDDPEQLYFLAMDSNPDSDGRFFVFPSMSTYGGGVPTISTDQGIEYLEYIIQEHPEYLNQRSKIYYDLALLHLRNGNIDSANRYLQQTKENGLYHYETVQKLRSILDIDSSREMSGTPLLSGKVTVGQQEAKGMFIVLRPKGMNSWSSGGYSFISEYPVAITDANGEYRFYDVLPGDYEVGVSFLPEQVEGYYLPVESDSYVSIKSNSTVEYNIPFVSQIKVNEPINHQEISGDTIHFRWEPYPGAAYYQVAITMFSDPREASGSRYTTSLVEKWTETYAEYDIASIRKGLASFNKFGDGEKSYLAPASILGPLYPGGQFSWMVEAFDQEGNRLSSSAGYYLADSAHLPLFSTDARDQLKGDRYVLNFEYDKAIASYEQESDNPYARLALIRMYHNGLSFEDEGDKQKSLHYLLQIPDPTEIDMRMIAEAYEVLEQFDQAKEMYTTMIERFPDDWMSMQRLAKIVKREGDHKKALELYEQALTVDSSNDSSDELVLLYLLEKEYDKALHVAEKHPYKYHRKNLYPLLTAIEKQGWDNHLFKETLLALDNRDVEMAKKLISQFPTSERVYADFLSALGYELYLGAYDDPSYLK